MSKRLTAVDPAFLEAVSQAFKDLLDRRPDLDESKLAEVLGIDQTTLSKYIHKRNCISGDVLARACVDYGLTLTYKGFAITAGAFGTSQVPALSKPLPQLEFSFDARYENKTNTWASSHQKLEPMEFLLRVKVAS
ncbi:MAG: helix-turn-helix transcriptional regulator [Bryobacteraceae bacterium]